MRDYLFALSFIGLTGICWGMYGPVLHRGQVAMEGSRLRPFFCVGVAYFLIAVVVPIVVLQTRGEAGAWKFDGVLWSTMAGVAGAVGALGIVLAFAFGGSPKWVMPLVFGFAPIVNAFLTIYWAGYARDTPPMQLGLFLAGLIMVGAGAFMVLFFAPKDMHPAPAHATAAESAQEGPAKKPAEDMAV